MIFTVAVVIVDSNAFVDPRLDTLTPIIRNVLRKTTGESDSFEVITANVVPQHEEDIRTVVKDVIRRNSVDWILVVGGIGFEGQDCTPEVRWRHTGLEFWSIELLDTINLTRPLGDRATHRATSTHDNQSYSGKRSRSISHSTHRRLYCPYTDCYFARRP